LNELQNFRNDDFGQIRAIEINNEPWFVGRDIAHALGYLNASDALVKHVDDEDKDIAKCDTLGGKQSMAIINESGLYSLILGSKLPAAKKFKRWVTSEVLPSLRRNGGYILNQDKLSPEELMANAIIVAQNIIKQKDKQLEEQKPKVLFADAVLTSKQSILVGELAKLLKQNGVDIGEKRLFQYMRDNGYLIKRNGTDYNMPTQRSMELGILEIKERSISNPSGSIRITKTSKVTGKGQQYFINKFLNTE
jgi:anti-repressor protein